LDETFNFHEPELCIVENPDRDDIFKDKSMGLWRVEDLPDISMLKHQKEKSRLN